MSLSKDELREMMRGVVREVLKERETQNPPQKGHTTIEELIDCPDCYPKARNLVFQKLRNADYECTECGLGVDGKESENEDWKCPQCGNEYAEERERNNE